MMLDIGWSELLLVAVVAIVVIGPKELPAAMRSLGRMATKMRRMAGEFRGQFDEAMREANLDEVKREFDTLRQTAASLRAPFNPGSFIENQINASIEESKASMAADSASLVVETTTIDLQISQPGIEDPHSREPIPSAFAPLPIFRNNPERL